MEKVFVGVLSEATDRTVIVAARAALDFIYYAQFEVHTTETLDQMDKAWSEFHKNKMVFIHCGVQVHFNINKLHNVKHYTDHIRLRGTADGFNTEASERLHIDCAKSLYRATNHREHIKQMTHKLQRLEAIDRFQRYLTWRLHKTHGKSDREVEEDTEEGSQEPVNNEDGDIEDSGDGITTAPLPLRTTAVVVPKSPFYGNLTINSIERDFNAPWLLNLTETFLRSEGFQCLSTYTNNDCLPVHASLTLQLTALPQHSTDPTKDVVHATKLIPAINTPSGYKPAKPARSDTVFVRMKKDNVRAANPLLSGKPSI